MGAAGSGGCCRRLPHYLFLALVRRYMLSLIKMWIAGKFEGVRAVVPGLIRDVCWWVCSVEREVPGQARDGWVLGGTWARRCGGGWRGDARPKASSDGSNRCRWDKHEQAILCEKLLSAHLLDLRIKFCRTALPKNSTFPSGHIAPRRTRMKNFKWGANELVFLKIQIADGCSPYHKGQLVDLQQGPGIITDFRYFRTTSANGTRTIVAEIVTEIVL